MCPSGHVPLTPERYARSRVTRSAGSDVWRDTVHDTQDHPTDAVVVGYDGSDAADGAVEWAAVQAVRTGGRLDLVTAWEYPTSWGNVIPLPSDFDPAADAKAMLDPVVERLAGRPPGPGRPRPRHRGAPVGGAGRGVPPRRAPGGGQPGPRQLLGHGARLGQPALRHPRRLPRRRVPEAGPGWVTSELLAAVIDGMPPDFAGPDADVRATRAMMAPLHGHPLRPDTDVRIVTAGGVRCGWLSTPATSHERGAAVFFHGGAFVSCDLEAYLFYAEFIADHLRVPVVTIDYRLAPEHRFPAAFDDCTAAFGGLVDDGLVPERTVFVGDSCGGGLALATAAVGPGHHCRRSGRNRHPVRLGRPRHPRLRARWSGRARSLHLRGIPPESGPGLPRSRRRPVGSPGLSGPEGTCRTCPRCCCRSGEVDVTPTRRRAPGGRGTGRRYRCPGRRRGRWHPRRPGTRQSGGARGPGRVGLGVRGSPTPYSAPDRSRLGPRTDGPPVWTRSYQVSTQFRFLPVRAGGGGEARSASTILRRDSAGSMTSSIS